MTDTQGAGAAERWATGDPYRHDKYGWACLTWYRVRDFTTEHGKMFLSASDLGPEIARQLAQANTDYLNALEDRVQALEQQLEQAREWATSALDGETEMASAMRHILDALTASPAQSTEGTQS